MARLHIAVLGCIYQEVARQLKEHFIHGLNDKNMLEEIIKELTATNNNDHITSGEVLVWAKRVEDAEGPGSSFKHVNRVKTV